ncbi:ThuA domain-containing protein [Rhizoctonia solani AG-1 IA]|uniref:ThuA domain-containing protein n=1 Tax=Thanatephorus cucumeris (strain AG1-IA) TaxID=983506 RepID=L8WGW5_THACA|nr:ThuA domain-containing protein [Rhizoctonia solani AG-1 IA]
MDRDDSAQEGLGVNQIDADQGAFFGQGSSSISVFRLPPRPFICLLVSVRRSEHVLFLKTPAYSLCLITPLFIPIRYRFTKGIGITPTSYDCTLCRHDLAYILPAQSLACQGVVVHLYKRVGRTRWDIRLPGLHIRRFRHDSIPVAIQQLKAWGPYYNISFDATEDQKDFTVANLAKYDALLFVHTTENSMWLLPPRISPWP